MAWCQRPHCGGLGLGPASNAHQNCCCCRAQVLAAEQRGHRRPDAGQLPHAGVRQDQHVGRRHVAVGARAGAAALVPGRPPAHQPPGRAEPAAAVAAAPAAAAGQSARQRARIDAHRGCDSEPAVTWPMTLRLQVKMCPCLRGRACIGAGGECVDEISPVICCDMRWCEFLCLGCHVNKSFWGRLWFSRCIHEHLCFGRRAYWAQRQLKEVPRALCSHWQGC